jgi:hypothetical protein
MYGGNDEFLRFHLRRHGLIMAGVFAPITIIHVLATSVFH